MANAMDRLLAAGDGRRIALDGAPQIHEELQQILKDIPDLQSKAGRALLQVVAQAFARIIGESWDRAYALGREAGIAHARGSTDGGT